MFSISKKLAVWKPFKIGQRVELTAYRKGARGVIVEKLGVHKMNGLDIYGVKLDGQPNATIDMLRYELKRS